jgi:hypothetical protein
MEHKQKNKKPLMNGTMVQRKGISRLFCFMIYGIGNIKNNHSHNQNLKIKIMNADDQTGIMNNN